MAFVLNFICCCACDHTFKVPDKTCLHIEAPLPCMPLPSVESSFLTPDPSVLMGNFGSAADLMLDRFAISSPGVELLKQSNYSSLSLQKTFFFFFFFFFFYTFLGVISVDYLRSSCEFHLNEFICFNGGWGLTACHPTHRLNVLDMIEREEAIMSDLPSVEGSVLMNQWFLGCRGWGVYLSNIPSSEKCFSLRDVKLWRKTFIPVQLGEEGDLWLLL